jgi:hypothetical protein
VGPAGTPSKHPYRLYCFAGKDNKIFLGACATGPETVLTIWRRMWELDFVSVRIKIKIKNKKWCVQEPWIPKEKTPPPKAGGTSNNNNVAVL